MRLLLYFLTKNIVMTKIVALCILIGLSNGYPIQKKEIGVNPGQTNEKTYPNGTVVGKYYYKDNEGNPVHVKYYADDSGYGVELKTVKVNTPDSVHCQDKSKPKYMLNPEEEVESTTTTFSPMTNYLMTSIPTESFVKDFKSSEAKYKTNPDYEIFVNNELKTPKKCGQTDKVHVYYEKNKRKSRQTLNEFDALRYCEQMFS